MASFFQRWEKTLVCLLIIVFFLLNLAIASRSPFGGWMDEVTYVDPGLNLADGKGWTSSAWPWETDHEFFASNSPLYPAGLSLWVRVFGMSMVADRAYCYVLATMGISLLWVGTYRLNLLTPAYRLLWIALLSTEYGMNWMERNERYDVWIFLGLTLAWFGASLRTPLTKYLLIYLGCFLIPFAGFIGATYVVLISGLVCLLTWFKFWKEALVAVVGAVSGVVGVGLFFSAFGRFEAFRKSVSYLTALEQGKWHSPYAILVYPSDDVGVAIMIALLGILSFYYWRHPIAGSARWLGLGWGIIILMPCMMFARGAFPMMYFYMVIIPVSLAILQLSQQALSSPRGRHLALAITVIMGMLCLGGLPARLYTSWKDWEFRNPQHMRDFVRTYVHPDDAVFSDYPFYFELRDYAKFVAMPAYRWVVPPDEARQINVAIVRDKDMPDLTRDASGLEGIGGGWKKVAVFPTPEMQSTGRKGPDGATFTLYRRDPAAP